MRARCDLFGELFLAQLVQDVELLREEDVLQETVAGQLDAHDDLSVRDHHRHGPELDLQVLRQLLATGIARVLRMAGQSRTKIFHFDDQYHLLKLCCYLSLDRAICPV